MISGAAVGFKPLKHLEKGPDYSGQPLLLFLVNIE